MSNLEQAQINAEPNLFELFHVTLSTSTSTKCECRRRIRPFDIHAFLVTAQSNAFDRKEGQNMDVVTVDIEVLKVTQISSVSL